MKCSLDISNFLEEIASLSHSVVFLYFFALIAEEGFLISSCYFLEFCIQMLISFLFSPYPLEMLRGLKQNLMLIRDWARPAFECLSVSCSGMGQQWPAAGAGALGATDLVVALALLEEVTIYPIIELPELTQDWGNKFLEGTDKTLCTPGPRRKEQWPHKRLTQICLWCPGVSSRGIGQWWPAAGLKAPSAAVCAWKHLKEVSIFFITSTMVWSQVKQQGENTAWPNNRKLV